MKIKKKVVYVTSDEKEFSDMEEAESHQRKLDNIAIATFIVHFHPDLTEGRGYLRKGVLYVGIDQQNAVHIKDDDVHRVFAENWCNERIGHKIEYIQGRKDVISAMSPWSLRRADGNDKLDELKELGTIWL